MFYDVGSLLGVIALITIVVNLLKLIPGFIKDGATVANATQTILSVVLTVIGVFFPSWLDSVPMVDEAAGLLAKLLEHSYAFVVLIIPLFVQIGNLFHDIFSRIPFLNKSIGYRLTAD